MKRFFAVGALVLFAGAIILSWGSIRDVSAKIADYFYGDPDRPAGSRGTFDEAEYLKARDEYFALLHGAEPGKPFDPTSRQRAVNEMERQRASIMRSVVSGSPQVSPQLLTTWTPIGPFPIPNGQVTGSLPVSGRTTALAIDPGNSNKVYLGTAHGGVYRSTDGGMNWTQIFDSANTSAVGSLALAPSNPSILYVGTGESNGSADSYAGVGLYRIDNCDTTASLVGPINPVRNYLNGSGSPVSSPVFNGRSISNIQVNPTDPSILYVGIAGGVIGIGGEAPLGNSVPPLGMRGLIRLTNATSAPASVVAEKIAVTTVGGAGFDTPNTGNLNVNSIFVDPSDPNIMVVWLNGSTTAGNGGIYRTTNAQAASPTFTQVFTTTLSSARGEFAGYRDGANTTIYVATGDSNGRLRRSVDGGATWSAVLTGGQGFCGGQCFYNIGLDVRPGATTSTTDDIVVLGGNVGSSSTTRLFAKSTDGGATFTETSAGLHADTHFIEIDPSNANVIWHGNDGGVFKSTNGGTNWSSLNNTQLNTVQFSGLAIHPTIPGWAIGGTQDNGTNLRNGSGIWTRVDFGDGGYALLDRNATDESNITLYHTYFNQTNNLIGFGRVTAGSCLGDGNWAFKGIYSGSVSTSTYCGGNMDTFNGIQLTDSVLFYAPMELGPGNPSTVYFGAGAVYRSADKGETMPAVSQRTTSPVSSIAVSPQDDNYRMFGRADGSIFYTTTGANPMTQLTGIPVKFIGRVKFDPSNKNVAYVALGGYFGGTSSAQSHVWKVTNLDTTPVVTAINAGLPDVPVNAFAVDPANGNNLYAGTDIGVYASTNGGTSWVPFGTGLPVVAVFGMEIQPTAHILRISTHGRGMWDLPLVQNRSIADYDGDGRTDVSVYRPSDGVWYANRSTAGFSAIRWGGTAGDVPIPGDYDGDGKADYAIWRPSDTPGVADFYILNSGDFTIRGYSHGLTTDIPVAGDFDGDGKNDIVVFRPSTGTWYLWETTTQTTRSAQFGSPGDIPMAMDNDGDGKANLAVYRPSDRYWYIARATGVPAQNFDSIQWGLPTDILVPGDYDGDGKADVAVFRPSDGVWYVLRSSNNGVSYTQFGASGDVPVPGDYDGDGKTDVAVYRNGVWYINGSTSGFSAQTFGLPTDKPIPAAYHP